MMHESTVVGYAIRCAGDHYPQFLGVSYADVCAAWSRLQAAGFVPGEIIPLWA